MAGTYLEGVSKVLSGVYTLIKAKMKAIIAGNRGVVSYCFTSDWGPVNVLTLALSGGEFKSQFNGDKTALTAAKIFAHAFKGFPQKVLGYRMATSAAAKGSVVLTGAADAASLTLETLYPSARAFVAVVRDAIGGGKHVEIIEGGVLLVSEQGVTVAELVAKLNVTDYVRVTANGAVLPANTAGAAFTGGNNGSAITVTEYGVYLDELEADGRANTFSLDAVIDEAILTVVEAWVKRVRPEGIYITWVRGGPAAWDIDGGSAANTKSTALNHRGIINVGNGCNGYTSAEMAIFIAARVAGIALNRGVTDEVVDYTVVNKKLKPGQRETCKLSGTLVFVMDGNSVLIDEAVNTLTAPTSDETVEMGKIRVNNTLDAVAKDLESFGNAYKQSRSNTPEARETYAATVTEDYLKGLAAGEIIQAGFFYEPDPMYHGKDAVYVPKIDEAFFHADITPVDSMERVYQKINVNF